MPPTRKQNGQPDDRRVLVDREEYAALLSLRESAELRLVDDEKVKGRIHDLTTTCAAQARRLVEADLAAQHLERVVALQRIFIDLLRADRPAVASLEDLSAFWRNWFLTTESLATRDPKQRGEVDKLEPDLFRSWRIWVRDAGRASRTFAVAGTTRVDVEALNSIPQATLQDHILETQRAQNASLSARVRELEAEVEAYRNATAKGKP
jgi:hypothetical protein